MIALMPLASFPATPAMVSVAGLGTSPDVPPVGALVPPHAATSIATIVSRLRIVKPFRTLFIASIPPCLLLSLKKVLACCYHRYDLSAQFSARAPPFCESSAVLPHGVEPYGCLLS